MARAENRLNRMGRLVLLAGIAGTLLVMLLASCTSRSQDSIDFTLSTPDGTEITLSALAGKVVLVNFWTTWCPACKEEMPLLQSVYEKKQSEGLVVLGVDMQENGATVDKFLKENGLTFPVVLDTDGVVSRLYGVYYIPHTVIVDAQGAARRVRVGAFSSEQEILDVIAPLLPRS